MKNTLDAKALETLLVQAVKDFAAATQFPIVFGGYQIGGIATVSAVEGNRTPNLDGLRVAAERGLGGRALVEARPRFTTNYEHSMHITHDYDVPILSEGITALIAVPVVVDGEVRAVLYGGARQSSGPGVSQPGTSFLQTTSTIAQRFSRELSIHDEVQRRLKAQLLEQPTVPGPLLEGLRQHHAELRRLATDVRDRALRQRLHDLEQSLTNLGVTAMPDSTPTTAVLTVQLSPREIDVLTQVALGYSNLTVGNVLGLTESTIKSYLKSAMAKLDASSRHEAVAQARQLGIIV